MRLYPETKVHPLENGQIMLEAPWMNSQITCDRLSNDPLQQLEELYAFPRIHRLPFWFHTPRAGDELPESELPDTFSQSRLEKLFQQGSAMPGFAWQWPLTEILEQSQCRGTSDRFDPLAAFSALQRHILLDSLVLGDRGVEVKQQLEDKSSDRVLENRDMLIRLVHLSLHVTRAAPQILASAGLYRGESGELVREFIAAERGHDIFAIESLKALTHSHLSCEVVAPLPEEIFLLEILANCAESSPLGLAACLFAFEGLSYDTPVWTPWETLREMDPQHAVRGVGKHTEINNQGRHGEIGYLLAASLNSLGLEDICLAARLAELCVKARLVLFAQVYKSVGLKI